MDTPELSTLKKSSCLWLLPPSTSTSTSSFSPLLFSPYSAHLLTMQCDNERKFHKR